MLSAHIKLISRYCSFLSCVFPPSKCVMIMVFYTLYLKASAEASQSLGVSYGQMRVQSRIHHGKEYTRITPILFIATKMTH